MLNRYLELVASILCLFLFLSRNLEVSRNKTSRYWRSFIIIIITMVTCEQWTLAWNKLQQVCLTCLMITKNFSSTLLYTNYFQFCSHNQTTEKQRRLLISNQLSSQNHWHINMKGQVPPSGWNIAAAVSELGCWNMPSLGNGNVWRKW